jgi:hypothetical protein
MDEAASRGLAREKVWEWICSAIARDELPVSLPNNALLDTSLDGATTARSWQALLAPRRVLAIQLGMSGRVR